ncbi:MAG: hypothetical protein ACI84K_000937 [Pseudohongiellaceae bacterium]|jgi:hypothetical protein
MIGSIIKILIFIFIFSLSSCAVIHFENGEVVPDPDSFSFDSTQSKYDSYDAITSKRHRKWYHHTLYQFAEISNPLETNLVCTGLDWNQVTTEITPFDAIMGLLDNAIFISAASIGIDLWSPWSIEYSCKEQK